MEGLKRGGDEALLREAESLFASPDTAGGVLEQQGRLKSAPTAARM